MTDGKDRVGTRILGRHQDTSAVTTWTVRSSPSPIQHTQTVNYTTAQRDVLSHDRSGSRSTTQPPHVRSSGRTSDGTNDSYRRIHRHKQGERLQQSTPRTSSAANPGHGSQPLLRLPFAHGLNFPSCNFSASTAGDNGTVYQIVNNRDSNRRRILSTTI